MLVLVFHRVILGNSKSSSPNYAVQEYDAEKRIAEEIMKTVRKLGLPFKLDQLTEGLGNCFPILIIQQLGRPEIASRLNRVTTQITKQKTGPILLRHCVTEIEEEKLETRKESFGQVTQNKEKKMENQEKKNRGSG